MSMRDEVWAWARRVLTSFLGPSQVPCTEEERLKAIACAALVELEERRSGRGSVGEDELPERGIALQLEWVPGNPDTWTGRFWLYMMRRVTSEQDRRMSLAQEDVPEAVP